MAQNSEYIKRAVNQLFKNYNKALNEAVKYASSRIITDIYREAISCIDMYYESYDPNSYARTDSLAKCIVPYGDITYKNQYVTIQAGVEYHPSILENYAAESYNNASSKYGKVDGRWVIENYLDGIHPATNGSSISENTIYYEIVDPISPAQRMKQCLENQLVKVQHNILLGFVNQIL